MNWSSLRALGNSRLVQLTVLVPAFGYIIIVGEHFQTVTAAVELYIPTVQAAPASESSFLEKIVSLRLFFLYFGLTFLGLGSLVYQIFSPRLIKAYDSSNSYIIAERTNLSTSDFYALSSDLDEAHRSRFDPGKLDDQLGAMQASYRSKNSKWPLAILTSAGTYAVGSVLLTVPALFTFFDVLKSFITEVISAF